MRNIVNISLPEEMVKQVKKEVRSGEFATTSEFFRHLLRLWNTHKLAEELKRSKKDFEAGKGKVLKSLRDLRQKTKCRFYICRNSGDIIKN